MPWDHFFPQHKQKIWTNLMKRCIKWKTEATKALKLRFTFQQDGQKYKMFYATFQVCRNKDEMLENVFPISEEI